MSRLPVAAFVALAAATVAAFFVTQHLKVTTPLVTGDPMPHPPVINPVSGGVCPYPGPHGKPIPTSFRRMQISFYLLNRNDDVDVYIVKPDGEIVDQIASNVPMIAKPSPKRRKFVWDGRTSDGQIAPDGSYDIRVSLVKQGRTLLISDASTGQVQTVTVQTKRPAIRVTSVSGTAGERPAVIAGGGQDEATIHYTGTEKLRPQIEIFRSSSNGDLRLVKKYAATTSSGTSVWNGTLPHGVPAPQGTYLVGLALTDTTCNTVHWPATLHPLPGTTNGAGVTVRYLAAQPSLMPVAPGHSTTVEVDSRRHHYAWALRRAGSDAVLSAGSSSAISLPVRIPAGGADLYDLALRRGSHRLVVPVAAGPGSGASAGASSSSHGRVLVVLPALTWQATNPVDDDGDGIPNTLSSGAPVRLARPFVQTPAGAAAPAALIAYLRHAGLPFTLTTDLALIDGQGPPLHQFTGVVLAGDERWLPRSTGAALRAYVQRGGRVLSLGIGSLQRTVRIAAGEAVDPSAASAVDFLAARPRPLRRTHGQLLLVQRDKLGIFRGTAQALSGYRVVQPYGPLAPPARLLSAAGVSSSQPAVIGYALGRGRVVAIGLPGFAMSLAHNVDAKELLGRVWSLLQR